MIKREHMAIILIFIIVAVGAIFLLPPKRSANAASYNEYDYLRIPNHRKNLVEKDGFKQYGFWELYIGRSDGQKIRDNDGVYTTDEIITFTWDLYIKTEPMERKPGAGFLGSTIGARVVGNGGDVNINYYPNSFSVDDFVWPEKLAYVFPLFKDANANPDDGKHSNNHINPGHDFYKIHSNISGTGRICLSVFYVTAWENCWWGGTYDETWRDLYSTSVYMRPDNTAPVLSFTNINKTDGSTRYSAQNVAITSNEPYADIYVNGIKQSGNTKTFTANGIYNLKVMDQNGNQSTYTLVIDKNRPTALYSPMGAFESITYGTETTSNGVKLQSVNLGVTRHSVKFTFTANPSGASQVSASYLRSGGYTTSYSSGTELSAEGNYTLTLTDKVGHKTIYNFQIDKSPPSANISRLSGSVDYRISKWYMVNLPSIMGGGKYSYSSYQKAINFATGIEKVYCVTTRYLGSISDFTQTHLIAPGDTVRSGTYWQYKAESSPDIYLYYFDEAHLNRVVKKYAEQYVQSPSYFRLNDSVFPNDYGIISDIDIYHNKVNITGIDAYLITKDFAFTSTGENESKTISYMHMGTGQAYINFSYNTKFSQQVPIGGLYRIRETDRAGNTAYYYIYLDYEAPYIDIEATTYGSDNTIRDIISVADIPVNGNLAYYYATFSITQVFDSDPWYILQIENSGTITRYTKEDELPVLGAETGGGEYAITLYDRSKNSFTFKVYILGRAPGAVFRNQNGNTEFFLTVTTGESFNSVMDIKIYKNGILLNDPNGYDEYPSNPDNQLIFIDPQTLSYVFTKGGTYTVELTDNFGRQVSYTHKFDKDLPKGTLKGALDKGRTNKDVTFEYNHNSYNLMAKMNGTEINLNASVSGNITIALFEALEHSGGKYELKLVNKSDPDNYNTYTFEIDLLPPNLVLTGVNEGGTCGGEVFATWIDTDVAAVTYSLNDNNMGAYRKGQILSVGGNYTITAQDDLGNTVSLTFTIDKSVDYTITAGKEQAVSAVVTNKDIVIIANETLSIVLKKDGEVLHYNFGDKLMAEGKYQATLTDNYDNTETIYFEIDLTPPEVFLAGVTNNCATNGNVYIDWADDSIEVGYSIDNQPSMPYSKGYILDAHGSYIVTAWDRAGNITEYSFKIDKIVDFSINVIDGGVSNGPVIIHQNEPLVIEIAKYEESFDYAFGEEIAGEGQYVFKLSDRFGNILTYNFMVVKMSISNFNYTVPETYDFMGITKDDIDINLSPKSGIISFTESGKYMVTLISKQDKKEYSFTVTIDNIPPEIDLKGVDNNGWTSGEVRLENLSKPGAKISVLKDGVPYNISSAMRLRETGEYEINIIDNAGNESTYRFTIVYKMSGISVVLISALGAFAAVAITVFIVLRRRQKVA